MNNRKISTKREQKIAKATGGRSHAGSGSLWWKKSDASDSAFQYEDKFTKNKYFSLSLKILDKIEKEAMDVGKLPVLVIGFAKDGTSLSDDFAVLRAKDCVIEDMWIAAESYDKSSHRISLSQLMALYHSSNIILMRIYLRGKDYYILPWESFVEKRQAILEGEKIQ